ncbi:MAG: uracil-DNA glycosylase family protein [Salinigranum sp.]
MTSDPSFPADAERNVLEPDCARCPALVEARERISWGNGPTDAEVMVVGEAPGAGDPDASPWAGGNHTGLAYTSRHSGRRVRALFESIGYGSRTYYTNAVKCFPADTGGDGDRPTNREPTREELDECRGHLRTEIGVVDPAVVVATGRHATETLLAFEGRTLDGFLDRVLDPTDLPTVGVPLLPILHPSYQDVWIGRLGYANDEYEAAVADALEELGAPPDR